MLNALKYEKMTIQLKMQNKNFILIKKYMKCDLLNEHRVVNFGKQCIIYQNPSPIHSLGKQ